MAITGNNGERVDISSREALLDKEIDPTIIGTSRGIGGPSGGGAAFGGLTRSYAVGADLAGITADFVQNFTNAIDEYKANVSSKIEAINSSAESTSAFKGANVTAALEKFITAIKTVASNYLQRLTDAELSIIQEVQKSYENQDTNVSSDFNSDISKLESE